MRIELFSGTRNPAVYRDWKRSVQAVELVTGMKDGKLAVLAWSSLRGEARALTDTLDLETLAADQHGLKTLWKLLDARYERQSHDQYDYAQQRYDSYRRANGQTMQEYIAGLEQARRELLRVDRSLVIGEMAYARKMLRSSGLSREEQRLVLSSAQSTWGPEAIEMALLLMFSDAHYEDRHRRDRRLGMPFRSAASSRATSPARSPARGRFPGRRGRHPSPPRGTFVTEYERVEGDEEVVEEEAETPDEQEDFTPDEEPDDDGEEDEDSDQQFETFAQKAFKFF